LTKLIKATIGQYKIRTIKAHMCGRDLLKCKIQPLVHASNIPNESIQSST